MCRALGRVQVQDLLSSVFSSGPLTAAEMSKFTSAGLSGLANFPSIPLVGPPSPRTRTTCRAQLGLHKEKGHTLL